MLRRKQLAVFNLSVAAPGRYLEAVVLSGDDEGFQTQGRPPQLLSERT